VDAGFSAFFSKESMSTDMTHHLRCLIVEDQALIAMSIETYLEDAGMSVQTVASIAEARVWLDANSANIAIVDFMLKDGPATELAGNLKKCASPS
jgi:DNA-binding response OmpR family regulator